jgi:heat-inducible transcriptional repressor
MPQPNSPETAQDLTERERQVLGAVIETYVETAEPAGSRTISQRSGLGLSAASIRNTMSDLEEKGYLYHPHTSAGRIPTDRAYRAYVDALLHSQMTRGGVEPSEMRQLREELAGGQANVVDELLTRAAQVLGVLTQELGLAVGPSLAEAVLERLELIRVSSDRMLLVLTLRSGVVRTIFVDVPSVLEGEAVVQASLVLNQRLAGLSLKEIRQSLPDRLRDAGPTLESSELLNIFIEEADALFDVPGHHGRDLVLGSTQALAGQPEFSSAARMQQLMEVTEHRDLLRSTLSDRKTRGLTISIGSEHPDPTLAPFTLVTSSYRCGPLSGVIGVMGPTRMPYEKVVALVDHTSRLIGDLLQ